eukprot:2948341-Ditylum_brightwellii.AAC.1
MTRRRNAARLSVGRPGLVEKKIAAQSRAGISGPVLLMLQSVYILRAFDCCVHIDRIGSENLPAGTDSFTPLTTQPPADEPSHSSLPSEDDDNGVKDNESLEVSPPDTSRVSM